MKTLTKALFATVLSLAVLAGLSSCADENGLHDQNALMVTFEFVGFGNTSGNFALVGGFDGKTPWTRDDTDAVDVTFKNGAGTSVPIAVVSPNIKFSIVDTGSWNRSWYVEGVYEGNVVDEESETMQNFANDADKPLNLAAGEVTVVVDASSGKAVLTIQ